MKKLLFFFVLAPFFTGYAMEDFWDGFDDEIDVGQPSQSDFYPYTWDGETSCMMPGQFLPEIPEEQCSIPPRAAAQDQIDPAHVQYEPARGVNHCSICQKSFKLYGIKQHVRQSHPDYFICAHRRCPYCTDRKEDFEAHLNEHGQKRLYKCTAEGCTSIFATSYQLKAHQLTHERSCACILCGQTFKGIKSYHEHLKKIHPQVNDSQPLDPGCSAASESETGIPLETQPTMPAPILSEEIGVASGCVPQRSYAVPIPQSTAPTAKKQHQCVCGKVCRTPADLKKHQMTHTQEKPCNCWFCDKTFRQLGQLYRHMMTKHDKEQPFKCKVPECGMVFQSKKVLNDHEKIHLKEHSSFIYCPYCKQPYISGIALDRHIQSKHPTNPDNIQLIQQPIVAAQSQVDPATEIPIPKQSHKKRRVEIVQHQQQT